MKPISRYYHQACLKMNLPEEIKQLLLRLLRELCTNSVRSRLAWERKESFLTLFFISAGRFPELASGPYQHLIGDWIMQQLPFTLTPQEQELLWT